MKTCTVLLAGVLCLVRADAASGARSDSQSSVSLSEKLRLASKYVLSETELTSMNSKHGFPFTLATRKSMTVTDDSIFAGCVYSCQIVYTNERSQNIVIHVNKFRSASSLAESTARYVAKGPRISEIEGVDEITKITFYSGLYLDEKEMCLVDITADWYVVDVTCRAILPYITRLKLAWIAPYGNASQHGLNSTARLLLGAALAGDLTSLRNLVVPEPVHRALMIALTRIKVGKDPSIWDDEDSPNLYDARDSKATGLYGYVTSGPLAQKKLTYKDLDKFSFQDLGDAFSFLDDPYGWSTIDASVLKQVRQVESATVVLVLYRKEPVLTLVMVKTKNKWYLWNPFFVTQKLKNVIEGM